MCKLLDTRRFAFFAVQFQKQKVCCPLSEILFSDFRTRELDFSPSIFNNKRFAVSPLSPISHSDFRTGGHSISLGLCPTKLPVIWDIWPDQPDVPVTEMARG